MASEFRDTDRFDLNRSEVAVQVIEGEAVAIDVLTGKYHGMTGIACAIVHLLALGVDLGVVRDALQRQYPEAHDRIEAELHGFVERLVAERVVVRADHLTAPAELPAVFADLPYGTPVLETYDDMAELLALDPPMPTVLDTPWSSDAWGHEGSGTAGAARDLA